jgi:phospholipase C
MGYRSIRHIRYGPDWSTNVIGSSLQVITDVANGKLANVTWVTPSCKNSDHSACGSASGPQWVSDVVNAIGESRFWNSTVIFVMWDEVISPFAKRGYVSHVQYEHGSILKFVEDRFGLARLAASDTRANSPAVDCFDFSQPPRPFQPFGSRKRPQDVLRMLHEDRPQDPDTQ